MYVYGIQCHDEHANEIKLFDEALVNSCQLVQTIGIELIDKFLGQKCDFVTNLKQTFLTMSKSTDGNLTKNIDDISDNFTLTIENIWYTLIELETSLHERIINSMKLFNDTIRTIIENFNDKSNETFRNIRLACDNYFQSNGDGDSDSNNDTTTTEADNKTTRKRHMNIIDQKLDLMCTRANKWLANIIEGYEL